MFALSLLNSHLSIRHFSEMSLELLLNNVTLGKEILLVEDDMKRSWGESGEEGSFFEEAIPDLRSRHAGILLKDSDEVGSWYGWGDGEGMYLEGDGGPWVGEWEGREMIPSP